MCTIRWNHRHLYLASRQSPRHTLSLGHGRALPSLATFNLPVGKVDLRLNPEIAGHSVCLLSPVHQDTFSSRFICLPLIVTYLLSIAIPLSSLLSNGTLIVVILFSFSLIYILTHCWHFALLLSLRKMCPTLCAPHIVYLLSLSPSSLKFSTLSHFLTLFLAFLIVPTRTLIIFFTSKAYLII